MQTTHTRAWRNFKRMEDCACVFASLVYAGGCVHAWRVLPGGTTMKLMASLGAPLGFLALAALIPLAVGPLRRMMSRYVWMSFVAGFGQTPFSIVSGLGILGGAAVLIYLQIAAALRGGPYPASIFAAYAAGIGVLLAQAALVRVLERDPEVKRIIEEPA